MSIPLTEMQKMLLNDDAINWNRKVVEISHVTAKLSSKEWVNTIDHLATYTLVDLYGYSCFKIFNSFKIETPQLFKLRVLKRLFLVDTSGYDYCRYITEIV